MFPLKYLISQLHYTRNVIYLCKIESWTIWSFPSSPMNLILPSIFLLAKYLASSSSSVASGPTLFSYCWEIEFLKWRRYYAIFQLDDKIHNVVFAIRKCIHYRYSYFAYLFSNSSLHLLSRSLLNVLVFSEISASKFGAFSSSRLHNCAYIDEYFGSSRAFSNI